MFDKKTIRDIDIKDQIVLVRTDYNVPLKEGKVADDLRIRESLPTIEHLLQHSVAKIVIMSHLGRPEGKKSPELSLQPVAETLQKLLPKTEVKFVSEVSGPEVEMTLAEVPEGGILMLENLRFYPEETENSEDFMREIVDSTHAGIFVQDGFAVLHRKHASTDAIINILPSVAGLLVEKEVTTLTKVREQPDHPLALIIGGAKGEDKQHLIEQFTDADQIIVGGKIAADGYQSNLPNIYVAEDFDEDTTGAKLDIGPVSTAKIAELLTPAKTIIWNGALGKVEDPTYATSSLIIAQEIGKKPDITSVICGGDTTAFVRQVQKHKPELKYTLISTGGGASLELLLGKNLPGLSRLQSKLDR